MSQRRKMWSIQIIALDSVRMSAYEVRPFHGSQDEAIEAIKLLSSLPRPLAIGTGKTCYWLHPGDVLVAVPVEGAP